MDLKIGPFYQKWAPKVKNVSNVNCSEFSTEIRVIRPFLCHLRTKTSILNKGGENGFFSSENCPVFG